MQDQNETVVSNNNEIKNSAVLSNDSKNEVRTANIKFFDDDYAVVSLHAGSEKELKEILKIVEEARFITARVYYKGICQGKEGVN